VVKESWRSGWPGTRLAGTGTGWQVVKKTLTNAGLRAYSGALQFRGSQTLPIPDSFALEKWQNLDPPQGLAAVFGIGHFYRGVGGFLACA